MSLMDIFSAIVVVVPLIVPMGEAFGIDPVHLGIIFLANLELGYLTPPVGMNLFLSWYRFGKPMPEVYRAAVPMLLVLLAGVLLITYLPPMTTALPRWLGRQAASPLAGEGPACLAQRRACPTPTAGRQKWIRRVYWTSRP